MNRLALMVLKNIFILPGAYGKLCRYAKRAGTYPEKESWAHIAYIMRRAIAAGNVDLQVEGIENLYHDTGFMLYGNHQGMFDVVAIAATCPPPLGCVYKKEINSVPLLKQIYACTKSFAMDREDARQSLQVIQAVTEEVKKGRNYLIFPEGTRSRKGNEMLPFHGGSFRCAIKAKCPVVPIAFVDSFRVLDEKGSHPVTVKLRYLKPIQPEEFEGMKAAQLAELVKSRIEEAIAEMM
ncbi:MAG: 1-acyl-sn-glycerol-3-phosphate acyltransferase [Oscillospiraceae bacterium]|nr:1-acyl-sn-glycerol-3-phosphate acyltransferase [Oscillospiraceae bacterium]MBQ8797910.1 1-acyl-sn-glycerol-3-phosphate acyltransferase [Oscillospiraceae bacterium]